MFEFFLQVIGRLIAQVIVAREAQLLSRVIDIGAHCNAPPRIRAFKLARHDDRL